MKKLAESAVTTREPLWELWSMPLIWHRRYSWFGNQMGSGREQWQAMKGHKLYFFCFFWRGYENLPSVPEQSLADSTFSLEEARFIYLEPEHTICQWYMMRNMSAVCLTYGLSAWGALLSTLCSSPVRLAICFSMASIRSLQPKKQICCGLRSADNLVLVVVISMWGQSNVEWRTESMNSGLIRIYACLS